MAAQKTKAILIAYLSIIEIITTLCACSHTLPNKLVLYNQAKSNYAAGYGNLPLEIKLYSMNTAHPQLANTFYQTWNNADKPRKNQTLLAHTTISANTTTSIPLQIPKSQHYLTLMAHFYNPPSKRWYASIERPHNLAWIHNYLQANISAHGIQLSFTQHDLGGL
jgi:hypothetical protein